MLNTETSRRQHKDASISPKVMPVVMQNYYESSKDQHKIMHPFNLSNDQCLPKLNKYELSKYHK